MHLLLYLACIFIALQTASGCAHLSESLELEASLDTSQRMMERGEFQEALLENEKALSQPFQFSKDRLLFQRGVLYSHPSNPEPDYFKAVGYLQNVVDQYPRSDLRGAAEGLVVFLKRISSKQEETRILTEKIDWLQNALSEQRHWMETVLNEHRAAVFQFEGKSAGLRADIEKLIAENGRLQNTLQKQRADTEAFRQELANRDKEISGLNSEIEALKANIEKLKKIDLNIEKRKKNADIK